MFYDFFYNNDNLFSVSGFYFFNVLQAVDYPFLHKDFYNFYPIIKYMYLRDIFSANFSFFDFSLIRNSLLFVERDPHREFMDEKSLFAVDLFDTIYSDVVFQNKHTKD